MINRLFRLLSLLFIAFVLPLADVSAQCAMCRATIENNVSNGEIGIGAGLNFGILYLFVTPYLLIGIVGYLWYKNSKANAKKLELSRRNLSR